MALTRDFRDTVKARAASDSKFRQALLKESIDSLLSGDLDTGKTMLRDYINATIGFEKLATVIEKSPKSLMRMFSHEGNPRADNIFSIISTLQQNEGVQLHVHTVR